MESIGNKGEAQEVAAREVAKGEATLLEGSKGITGKQRKKKRGRKCGGGEDDDQKKVRLEAEADIKVSRHYISSTHTTFKLLPECGKAIVAFDEDLQFIFSMRRKLPLLLCGTQQRDKLLELFVHWILS